MDQRQSEIQPHERFRSGEHTALVDHTNPPLRPPGITDPEPPKEAPVEDVTATLDRDKPAPGQPEGTDE